MPQNNSLLYWLTLAYVIGIPNFVHFDASGRTPDPINFTSIMSIIQTLLTAYLLAVCLILARRPVAWRRVNVSLWLWIGLLVQFTLASVLQPEFRFTASSKTDLLFAAFMLTQWVVGFLLIVNLYVRASPGRATDLAAGLIGRACWIWIAIVWIVLPIMPTQVYGDSDETSNGLRQLGGELIHPGKLATIAGIGCFYALFYFPRGPRKWIGCFWALVTIALTGARSGELAFVLALLVYVVFLCRNAFLKWGMIFGLIVASVVGFTFSDKLMKYVTRGQSMQTVSSLDDRTRIWQASWEAIRLRPTLGYGFIVGARKALKEHWRFTHWIPPHPHNEFIGSVMDGGFIALGFLVCIYALVFWSTWHHALRSPNPFLLVVFLQLSIVAMSGPILSNRYGVIGGISLLCSVAALGERATKLKNKSVDRRSYYLKDQCHANMPVLQA